MGKPKPPKTSGVPNRGLYSRISYLYQAAAYLSDQNTVSAQPPTSSDGKNPASTSQNLSRRLTTDLRAVSLKTQIRLSPSIKHSLCKHCDTLLIPGRTATCEVRNESRGGRKPWADMFVVSCTTCGRERKTPVDGSRQKRRSLREGGAKTGGIKEEAGVSDVAGKDVAMTGVS